MSSHGHTSGHAAPAAPLEFAFRAMLFVAVAVVGVAVATATHAWWTTAFAFAGVAFAIAVAQLKAVRLRTVARGDRAEVIAQPPGGKPVRFVLRRATPAELNAFDAPQVSWRIDSGATALL